MSGNSIKSLMVRILSPIFALAVFILMLPLTAAAVIVMLFTGIVAIAVLRYRLRRTSIDPGGYSNIRTTTKDAQHREQKPPIEGSYSVIDK